jgi:hypothetical protein
MSQKAMGLLVPAAMTVLIAANGFAIWRVTDLKHEIREARWQLVSRTAAWSARMEQVGNSAQRLDETIRVGIAAQSLRRTQEEELASATFDMRATVGKIDAALNDNRAILVSTQAELASMAAKLNFVQAQLSPPPGTSR